MGVGDLPEGLEDVFCSLKGFWVSSEHYWTSLFQQVFRKCLLWSKSFLVMEDRVMCGSWETDD